MRFVTVDNNRERLRQLSKLLYSVFPDCAISEFTDPLLSSKHVYENPVDAVFVEQSMRPADGFTLVNVLRQYKPELPIVMLSDTETFRAMSKQMRVDEYFVRPITDLQLRQLEDYNT